MSTKTCTMCKETKPLTEFVRERANKDGFTYQCKACRYNKYKEWRKRNPDYHNQPRLIEYRRKYYGSEESKRKYKLAMVARQYGLTARQYEELEISHNGLCAICGNHEKSRRNKSLAVDHCHETGKVRGMLCSWCNRALGLLKHDIGLLEACIKYLKERS